jgi:hypothetical protein
MNAKGWEQTGRRMVESFVQHWPAEALPLTVYAEDFDIDDMPGVEVRRLPAWLTDFKARWGKTPAYNGHRHGGYDYRFDAVKFAHKVAALTDFGLGLDDGVMIVIDADTYTHSPVTAEWLSGLFPEPAYIAWLDRLGSHPECGLVMYRASHPFHHNFMESFGNLYISGDIFKLRETHDSYALQQLVLGKVTAGKIPAPVSLSGDKRWHHPFVNGPLGACIDHLKGPDRKAQGRSRQRDLRNPRPEAYWREMA